MGWTTGPSKRSFGRSLDLRPADWVVYAVEAFDQWQAVREFSGEVQCIQNRGMRKESLHIRRASRVSH